MLHIPQMRRIWARARGEQPTDEEKGFSGALGARIGGATVGSVPDERSRAMTTRTGPGERLTAEDLQTYRAEVDKEQRKRDEERKRKEWERGYLAAGGRREDVARDYEAAQKARINERVERREAEARIIKGWDSSALPCCTTQPP
jgi:hypothetical protein